MQGQQISAATFRLAHLLLNGSIGNLVVTPNFDDFLARALTLFGQPPIVCDHPQTIGRISRDSDEIQIVHVHGTYWYYDCCNLRGEVEKRATGAQGPLTIPFFLDSLLWNKAPIVVGYSGWEGDVIMNALQRRLNAGETPFSWYWFCYKRYDFESLPSWLKNNPNVRFVLPKAGEERQELPSAGGAVSLKSLLAIEMGTQSVPTLPARLVFDYMVKSFALDSPQLTREPLKFFAEHLRKSIFQESSQQEGGDIFSFESVIARVLDAAAREEKRAAEASRIQKDLEGIREALRRSAYKEAIQNTIAAQFASATVQQKNEIIQLLFSAGSGLDDNSSDELAAYNRLSEIAEGLEVQSLDSRSTVAWCRALRNKAFCLSGLQQYEQAIVVDDEVVRRFGDAPEVVLRVEVAGALFDKGFYLGRLQRHEEAIAVYDEVVTLFRDALETVLRELVAKALFNKGFCLGELQRNEEAIGMYDEVVRRFGDTSKVVLREHVARALFTKGVCLGELQRSEEEMGVYDEVLRRFGNSTEVMLLEYVADALYNKALCLDQLRRNEEAIGVYDEIVQRYSTVKEVKLRRAAAEAMHAKYNLLKESGQSNQAAAVADASKKLFAADADPEIKKWLKKMPKPKHSRSAASGRN